MFTQRSRLAFAGVVSTMAIAIVALGAAQLSAGTISYFAVTGDADSGLSSAKTYTHTLDFGNNPGSAPVATVNGVKFERGAFGMFPLTTGSGIVGTGSTNQPASHDGNANANVTGNVHDLLTDFAYNASNTVIKLTGLTVGQTYDLRLYQRQWDAGGRPQRYGFDTDSVGGPEDVIASLDPDHATLVPPGLDVDNRAHAVSYTYTAQSPTLTITVDKLGAGTYHLYGLSNELTGPVVPDTVKLVRSLYSTGVDDLGKVLAPGGGDPHYTITTVPGGSLFVAPGPAVVQANNAAWLANDPAGAAGSSWISTDASGAANLARGQYVTQTEFDLSGFLPETARVMGSFAADDALVEVRLNGTPLPISGGGFTGYQDFEIPVGGHFRTITNTLEFVWSNGGLSDNPSGVRVELLALAERRKASPIPGLFNTGVDDNEVPLANDPGVIDQHYRITQNPTAPGSTDAHVEDQTAFPIVTGPWVANSATSKWIAPQFNTSGAATGGYTYETTFDLTGFYPATAEITGLWASDDGGLDILLNGIVVHVGNGGLGALTPFTVPVGSPFVEGINTLAFRLGNGAVGYTGLRVEDLVGTAVRIPEPSSILLLGLAGVGLLLAGRRRLRR